MDDGSVETDTHSYPTTNNCLASIDQYGAFTRNLSYDAAGNVTLDARGTGNYSFTYNAANRMESVAHTGVTQAEYTYNAQGQQVVRHLTQTGEVIHSVHDLDGNRIAEYEYDSTTDTSTRCASKGIQLCGHCRMREQLNSGARYQGARWQYSTIPYDLNVSETSGWSGLSSSIQRET